MKANSYIKFTNILDRIQLYFDSLDLSKIGMRGSIFTHTPHPPVVTEPKPDDTSVALSDSAKPTLRERGNAGNRQLQKHQVVRIAFALQNRRHRSINWRWQSQLMQWL